MTTIRAFIQRHPVVIYFTLAFAISWVGILWVVRGPDGFPATGDQAETLFLFVMLAWLAGPSLAGLLMTGLVSGRAGYRNLFTKMTTWRVGARWYAVALLTAPLLYLAVLLALSLFSAEFFPGIFAASGKVSLLLFGIAWGLLGGGFLEELGWTGFAIPRLMPRYGVFGTGLMVGLLWGAYHFSVVYWMDSPSGAFSLALLLAQLFAWLPAYRILMVWVYDRTESLLVAMFMHASATASMIILVPPLSEGANLTFVLAWAAVLWLAVAAVAIANHGQFSRQDKPPAGVGGPQLMPR